MLLMKKIYYCEDCGFLFQRMGEVHGCPYCEGSHIRPATVEETEHLETLLEKEHQIRKEDAK